MSGSLGSSSASRGVVGYNRQDTMNPGSLVRCRNSDCVLLPSKREAVHLLRPLIRVTDHIVAVHQRFSELIAYNLPEERVRTVTFLLSTPLKRTFSDSLHGPPFAREPYPYTPSGASPSRPHIYHFILLLVAPWLDAVRLLITDKVGTGDALSEYARLLDAGDLPRKRDPCRTKLEAYV